MSFRITYLTAIVVDLLSNTHLAFNTLNASFINFLFPHATCCEKNIENSDFNSILYKDKLTLNFRSFNVPKIMKCKEIAIFETQKVKQHG